MFRWPLTLLVMLIAFGNYSTSYAQTTHELIVGRAFDNTIRDSDVQSIVTKANKILAGVPHASCRTTKLLKTVGAQTFSDDLPRAITSRQDFNKIRDSGYSVNVVSQILWCGGHVVKQGQSFGGCTTIGNEPVIVTRRSRSIEATIWLHEIGHAQGLSDRCEDRKSTGCRKDVGWVMAGFAHRSNSKISEAECSAYAKEQTFPIIVEDGLFEDEGMTIDLLSGEWLHGVPLDAILSATPDQIEQARDIVRSLEGGALPNAILALGLVGEEADAVLFNEVMLLPAGNQKLIDAKLNVPIALGYLFNRFETRSIFGTLTEFRKPFDNFDYLEGIDDFDVRVEYARAISRNALVGISMAQFQNGSFAPAIVNYIGTQRASQEAGAYDLQVGNEFFDALDEISGTGSIEELLRQDQQNDK